MATTKATTKAKPPEKMTKANLLETMGRKLSKDELVGIVKALNRGYRPYVREDEDAGVIMPGWISPSGDLAATGGEASEGAEVPTA